MEEVKEINEKFRFSVKTTKSEESSTNDSQNFSSTLSAINETQNHISNSKSQKNKSLLDLIRVDPKAKLWECILTSIISINDFCDKGIKTNIAPNEYLENQFIFHQCCKEKQNLKMKQIIFNRNTSEKDSLLQITSHSSPIRRLDSSDQKRKFFIEKSLRDEKKIDIAVNFKITEYAYELFSVLRKANGILIEDIQESFDIERNFNLNVAGTSEMFGRSGATFFFTNDNKYVLKSISSSNADTFRFNFPKYFTHLFKNNEESMMVRIFGLYKIMVESYEKTYFVLMENLMEKLVDHLILRVYDLKGSKFQRNQMNFKNELEDQKMILRSIFGEKLNENLEEITNNMITDQILIVRGKDCNFLESDDVFISVKKEDKISFFENIKKDILFFQDCNLMDYSLIFIKALKNPHLKNDSPSKKTENQNKGKNSYKIFRNYESPDKKYIYSLAIVDYLQNYDLLKLMETQIKSLFQEKNQEISCVNSLSYGERFLKFIFSVIQSDSS